MVMMYRLHVRDESDYEVQWFGTKAEAVTAARSYPTTDCEIHVDICNVPTSRIGLAEAMNASFDHRTNFPGEEIKWQSKKSRSTS